jgi:hypothetical protein
VHDQRNHAHNDQQMYQTARYMEGKPKQEPGCKEDEKYKKKHIGFSFGRNQEVLITILVKNAARCQRSLYDGSTSSSPEDLNT